MPGLARIGLSRSTGASSARGTRVDAPGSRGVPGACKGFVPLNALSSTLEGGARDAAQASSPLIAVCIGLSRSARSSSNVADVVSVVGGAEAAPCLEPRILVPCVGDAQRTDATERNRLARTGRASLCGEASLFGGASLCSWTGGRGAAFACSRLPRWRPRRDLSTTTVAATARKRTAAEADTGVTQGLELEETPLTMSDGADDGATATLPAAATAASKARLRLSSSGTAAGVGTPAQAISDAVKIDGTTAGDPTAGAAAIAQAALRLRSAIASSGYGEMPSPAPHGADSAARRAMAPEAPLIAIGAATRRARVAFAPSSTLGARLDALEGR